MQNWIKLGKIFEVNKNFEWMYSHSSVPFAEFIKNNILKIYFSCRDKHNVSYIGYIIVNINNPKKILTISKVPVLKKSKIGTFDDSGTMGCCILKKNNKKYLYYIGWNLGVTVPFRNSIGLAISNDNGKTYQRAFDGPILDRNKNEPHFTASNCVINDNGIYKIWYLSATHWKIINRKPRHYYHIKYAESKNGIDWIRKGVVAYMITAPQYTIIFNGYKGLNSIVFKNKAVFANLHI